MLGIIEDIQGGHAVGVLVYILYSLNSFTEVIKQNFETKQHVGYFRVYKFAI